MSALHSCLMRASALSLMPVMVPGLTPVRFTARSMFRVADTLDTSLCVMPSTVGLNRGSRAKMVGDLFSRQFQGDMLSSCKKSRRSGESCCFARHNPWLRCSRGIFPQVDDVAVLAVTAECGPRTATNRGIANGAHATLTERALATHVVPIRPGFFRLGLDVGNAVDGHRGGHFLAPIFGGSRSARN